MASAINFAAVANSKNQQSQALVLDVAHGAVVADSVSPQSAERPAQSFAEMTRVLLFSDAVLEKVEDAPGRRLIQFA